MTRPVLGLFLALLLAWWALGPWVLVAVAVALCVPRARWWVLDRVWVTWRGAGIAGAVVAVLTGLVVLVPDGWLPIPPAPGLLVAPSYVGRPAQARPVRTGTVPQNPHLARNGAASDRGDAWSTGASSWAVRRGSSPRSTRRGSAWSTAPPSPWTAGTGWSACAATARAAPCTSSTPSRCARSRPSGCRRPRTVTTTCAGPTPTSTPATGRW